MSLYISITENIYINSIYFAKHVGRTDKFRPETYGVGSTRTVLSGNMVDMRKRLFVKSVAWKVEKKMLERIGHVLRMGNERLTEAMVLGWYESLEGRSKMIGKTKKTGLLHYIGRGCCERRTWRVIGKEEEMEGKIERKN